MRIPFTRCRFECRRLITEDFYSFLKSQSDDQFLGYLSQERGKDLRVAVNESKKYAVWFLISFVLTLGYIAVDSLMNITHGAFEVIGAALLISSLISLVSTAATFGSFEIELRRKRAFLKKAWTVANASSSWTEFYEYYQSPHAWRR